MDERPTQPQTQVQVQVRALDEWNKHGTREGERKEIERERLIDDG